MVMGCVAGKTTRTLIPKASLAISLDKDWGSVAEVRLLNCIDIDIRRSIRPALLCRDGLPLPEVGAVLSRKVQSSSPWVMRAKANLSDSKRQ